MISAWPKEQRYHPERKGRVTKVHPERTNHPSGRSGETRPSSKLWPRDLLCWGGEQRASGSPASQGPACVPTDAHTRLSQGASPLAWYFFPGGKCGSHQGSPCWGRAHRGGGPALPSPGQTGTHGSERGELVGRGRLAGAEQVLGGGQEGRRLGVGAEAGVRTSRRRYRHSDGSRRCCARRCRSHKARARQARPRTQRERNAPGEATHLAITFRLTEAYTGARAGGSHPPTPLPETHSLCLKVHESSRQPGWICRGPWLSRSSLIGGPG